MSRISWFARISGLVALVGLAIIVAAPFTGNERVGAGETAVVGIALLLGFGSVTVLELRHTRSSDSRLQ